MEGFFPILYKMGYQKPWMPPICHILNVRGPQISPRGFVWAPFSIHPCITHPQSKTGVFSMLCEWDVSEWFHQPVNMQPSTNSTKADVIWVKRYGRPHVGYHFYQSHWSPSTIRANEEEMRRQRLHHEQLNPTTTSPNISPNPWNEHRNLGNSIELIILRAYFNLIRSPLIVLS